MKPIVEINLSSQSRATVRRALSLDKAEGFWASLILKVPEGQGLLCRLPGMDGNPGECCAGNHFMDARIVLQEMSVKQGQGLANASLAGSHARVFRLGNQLVQVASMSRITSPTSDHPIVEFWFDAEVTSALRTRVLAHQLSQSMPPTAPEAASVRLRL